MSISQEPVRTREEFIKAIDDRISSGRRNIPIQVQTDFEDEIDLANIDVSGMKFKGIFYGVQFENNVFTSCDFSGVKFYGCNFDKVTFNGNTSLTGCDFNDTSFFNTIISDDTDISGSDFSKADDVNRILNENNEIISIKKLKERGAILGDFWLSREEQEEDIPGSAPVTTESALRIAIRDRNQPGRRNIPIEVNIIGEGFQQEITGIDASGLTFTGTFKDCAINDLAFNNCKLLNINFLNCELNIVSFINCNLDNCNFKEETSLTEVYFEACNITGMIISSDTELDNVDFYYLNGLDKVVDENRNNISVEELKDRGLDIVEAADEPAQEEGDIDGSAPVTTVQAFYGAVQDRRRSGRLSTPINVDIREGNITGEFSGLTIRGSFINITFSKVEDDGGEENSAFTNCNLSNVSFLNCELDNCSFTNGSSLEGTKFTNSNVGGMIIDENTNISGADFRDANDVEEIYKDYDFNNISIQELIDRGAILDDWLTEGLQIQSEDEGDMGVGPFAAESGDEGARPDFSDFESRFAALQQGQSQGQPQQQEEDGLDNPFLPENLLSKEQVESLTKTVLRTINIDNVANEQDLKLLVFTIGDEIYQNDVIQERIKTGLGIDLSEYLNNQTKPIETIIRAVDVLILNSIMDNYKETIPKTVEAVTPLVIEEMKKYFTVSALKTLGNPFLPENLLTEKETEELQKEVFRNLTQEQREQQQINYIDELDYKAYLLIDHTLWSDLELSDIIENTLDITREQFDDLEEGDNLLDAIRDTITYMATYSFTQEDSEEYLRKQLEKYLTVRNIKRLADYFGVELSVEEESEEEPEPVPVPVSQPEPEKELPRVKAYLNAKVEFNDPITLDEFSGSIEEYIDEDIDNVVIVYQKKKEGKLIDEYFLTNRDSIKAVYANNENTVYPCKEAKEELIPREENIINKPFFDLHKLGFVEANQQYCDMKQYDDNKNNQLFAIVNLDKKYPTFVSHYVRREGYNANVVGEQHCQEGQDGSVCKLIVATPSAKENPNSDLQYGGVKSKKSNKTKKRKQNKKKRTIKKKQTKK